MLESLEQTSKFKVVECQCTLYTQISSSEGKFIEPSPGLCEKGRYKKFCTIRVVMHWHRLPREEVGAPSLETLKVRLDGALSTRWSCRCPCSLQGSCTRWPSRVSSNSNDSMILWGKSPWATTAYCEGVLSLSLGLHYLNAFSITIINKIHSKYWRPLKTSC